jgi:hypothetical protein
MSVKMEFPLAPPVVRPELRSPVSPGPAKAEPVPPAPPATIADGFERVSPGAPPPLAGSSQFEAAGAVGALPPRLEPYRNLADSMVSLFCEDAKLSELARTDPQQTEKLLTASFLAAGVPSLEAGGLGRACAAQASKGPLGSTIQVDPRASVKTRHKVDTMVESFGPQVKSVADAIKLHDDILSTVKLEEGDTAEGVDAYTSLQLGRLLVDQGIELGKGGFGRDGFHRGEHLESLPAKLEPHRDALEKLTGHLLRDSTLDSKAALRKTLWTELKKLPFQDNASRHDARQYLLEAISLRQDRYTETH